MPFVTEQIWQALNGVAPSRGLPRPGGGRESVCIAAWPAYPDRLDRRGGRRHVVGRWQAAIAAIRNLKAERNVPKDAKIAPILLANGAAAEALRAGEAFIAAR